MDVRNVVPRERHTLDTFQGLKSGEAFVFVNDHDPKPLYYQFQAENTGQLSGSIWNKGLMSGGSRSDAGLDGTPWIAIAQTPCRER